MRITDPTLTAEENGDHPLHRTRSLDAHDRRAVESALVTEGVHRPITPTMKDSVPLFDRMDSAVMLDGSKSKHGSENQSHHQGHRHLVEGQTPPLATPSKPHSKHSGDVPGERGHAHDPMDKEPRFFGIGTGGHDDDSTATSIAESPTAAEFNIYDTAYQKEVERIREAQGHQATVYLTRRVDSKKEYRNDDNMVDLPKSEDVKGHPHEGFMNLLEKVKTKGMESAHSATNEETSENPEQQKETAIPPEEVEKDEKQDSEAQTDGGTHHEIAEAPVAKPPSPAEIKTRGKKLSELVDRAQEGLRKRGKEGNVMVSGLMQKVSAMGRKGSGTGNGPEG